MVKMLAIKVFLTSISHQFGFGALVGSSLVSVLSLEAESLLSSSSPLRSGGCLGWWVTFLMFRSLLVSDGMAGMSAVWE